MVKGQATKEGTLKYVERFRDTIPKVHFREVHGLAISSIGIGTYLGNYDQETDDRYAQSIAKAVGLGCNHVDTAINYRFQRSERSVGAALKNIFEEQGFSREEIVVATKGGYIPFDGSPPQDVNSYFVENFVKTGAISSPDEIVKGTHCISPKYLENQLEQSLSNLGIECIDIYYLHNLEEQLQEVRREEFLKRVSAAFELLEGKVEEGKIGRYGTATWSGYREDPNSQGYLSLEELVRAAGDVAGENHHFAFLQLPFNLAMPEALVMKNQSVEKRIFPLLSAAWELDIAVIGSATLLQSHLTHDLPGFIGESLTGLKSDAQRALQFSRSMPGITTSLVGMSDLSHVEENMEVAKVPPASINELADLFSRAPQGR